MKYTCAQLTTNTGALQAWRFKIGKVEDPECRHCGLAAETGDHLVLPMRSGRNSAKRSGSKRKPRRGSDGTGNISAVVTGLSKRRMQKACLRCEIW